MDHFDKIVTLANGGTARLDEAASHFACLEFLSAGNAAERTHLFHLRAMALGNTLNPEVTKELCEEGLLNDSGALDQVRKDVILSAVRGEGHNLFLNSPFTNFNERTIAEFMTARDRIRLLLPRNESEKIITTDPMTDNMNLIRKTWTRLINRNASDPSVGSSPSP